jgi:hypothetical protein
LDLAEFGRKLMTAGRIRCGDKCPTDYKKKGNHQMTLHVAAPLAAGSIFVYRCLATISKLVHFVHSILSTKSQQKQQQNQQKTV